MDRIGLFSALIIGVFLTPVCATAQRADKATSRSGRTASAGKTATVGKTASVGKVATASKPARTSQTSSTKGFTKTSKGASPFLVIPPMIVDGGAAALEEAVEVWRVTGLEQSRIHADVEKDKDWFEDHFADDLTSVTSDGRVENKAQLIARCLDPANTVESEKYEELNVRAVAPFGDMIVATGRLSQTVKGNNTQRRFTDVWVDRGGILQQVAVQISVIEGGNEPSQSGTPGEGQLQGPNTKATSPLQSHAASLPSQPTASASPKP